MQSAAAGGKKTEETPAVDAQPDEEAAKKAQEELDQAAKDAEVGYGRGGRG